MWSMNCPLHLGLAYSFTPLFLLKYKSPSFSFHIHPIFGIGIYQPKCHDPLCLSSNALDDMFQILTLNGTAMCQTEAHMQKTNQPTNPQNPDFFHLFHFIFFVFNLYHELNMLQKHRQKSDAHVTSWISVNKEIVSFFIPLGLHMAYGIKSQCG